MELDNTILKSEEKVSLALRSLYRQYGYSCFKMSKFEEYDLYGQNKDFLVSDSVITFTDTNGRLMALKPDVTLSMVKNFRAGTGAVQRMYYNENVYRISDRTHSYKEIMQAGLECLGEITQYNLCEVVWLAASSLGTISGGGILNLSHLGVLSALLTGLETAAKQALLTCVGEKNPHGVQEACDTYGVPAETARLLVALTDAYGAPEAVIARFRQLTDDAQILAALAQLETVALQAQDVPGVRVCVDLSLTSDMNYYNDLVFQGYVSGSPSCVLRGGQYDHLMAKMGKPARAIGFAVYLDQLERLDAEEVYDVDVLLLYTPETDPVSIRRRVAALAAEGCRVAAQPVIPEKLTYRRLERFGEEGDC